ncbi:MAG: hypothetical protein R3331_02085 [Sulfurospirillaceae bacterium]|nr:hypothetical protein [Sulfurospirillaceae bacterium]
MGFFGGSASSSGIVTSSINFNPSMQFGTDNTAKPSQSVSQTPKLTQTTKDQGLAAAASVGLGFGGSGSAGPASLAEAPLVGSAQTGSAAQPLSTLASNYKKYLPLLGLAGVGGYMLIVNDKSGKKAKK